MGLVFSHILLKIEISNGWINPPPKCTSHNWAVIDGNTGNLLFGEKHKERKEIASLTKIMTLYTTLSIAKKFNINLKEEDVTVSREASRVIGTRAEIKEGEIFKAYDLLFAMMLPSGNDVAQCLSEHFGMYLAKEATKININLMVARKHFIQEMNNNGKVVGLQHTKFNNPTGLGDQFNKLTAEDLGRLCAAAMKVPEFAEVVSTKQYKCIAKSKDGQTRECEWENTHKLLWKGYKGIKTGITPHAGPCLASC